MPERMLVLWPGDILTKQSDGTLTKHNGLCMMRIRIPESDLELVSKLVHIVIG
jgi:hypothetical protein